jgi:manganese oxidase
MNASPNRTIAGLIGYAMLLAYGGVAILQWVGATLLGDMPGAQMASMGSGEMSGYAHWLRDATTALPFVAAAVLLGARRYGESLSQGPNPVTAVLFAALMGAGSLLRRLFPETAHIAGASEPVSTVSLLQDTFIVVVVAALYALLIGLVLSTAVRAINSPLERLPVVPRWAAVVWPLVVVLVVTPVVALTGGERAVAQTTFPDQVIHPRGTLLLVARVLDDGTFAYVAPAYGDVGIRPIIEMTEGETLNITLKNEMHRDVSLHVHGVHYSQDSDGTRHSGSYAAPGEQHVYQWRAAKGTAGYWHYHDHVLGDDEGTVGILNGLYGGLIVRKPGDPKPAKTFMLVFHDLTINGRAYPNTPTPVARQGELVEFLVVSYMDRLHTFHLHAHRWLTPTRPSNPDPAAQANAGSGREDNHIMSPGDSAGFLAIAGDGVGPGMWMYHCHVQSHSAAMRGFFQVLPR